MDNKKAYTAISVAMGVVFANSLFWLGRYLLKDGLHYYSWDYWVNNLFTFLGIAGLIIFLATGFKNSMLLRIFMCKVVAGLPGTIFYEYLTFSNPNAKLFDPMVYVGLLLTMLIYGASIAGLWMLTRQRMPKLNHYMIGTESAVAEFAPASAWTRLANYAVDIALIYYQAYLFYNTMKYGRYLSRSYSSYSSSDNFGFPPELLPLVCLLLYYFILEGIFNTSAGKCATNTVIVNASGEVPSVGQRLGRTLCRLIPFEAFSFFGKNARGWHDTITETYVAVSLDKFENKEEDDELAGFLSTEQDDYERWRPKEA